MSINTIIGQAAQGEDFFPRPYITNQIWEKLEAGSNLLLVAPRRVGKSSILFNLQEKPNNGFIVIYYTSKSVNSENEFYKKLYHHLLENISNYHKYKNKMKSLGKDFLYRIEGIGKDEIQVGHSKLI